MSHLFNKEIERYKLALSHENSLALEKLKADLIRNAKIEDRSIEYEAVIRRYKGPLLHAVYDLQSRLYNITAQGFIKFYYLHGNGSEKEYAVNNTVYVIAQYFAWTEVIRREVQFIDFQNPEDTRALIELRNKVYRLWQTDEINDPPKIWAGEQRAIGELMIEDVNNRLSCIGYAEFLDKLENSRVPFFNKLQLDVVELSKPEANSYQRLKVIQHALIDILDYLDPEYIRFPKESREYVP